MKCGVGAVFFIREVLAACRAEAIAPGVGSWDDGSTAVRDLFGTGHTVRANVKALCAGFFSASDVPAPFSISSK